MLLAAIKPSHRHPTWFALTWYLSVLLFPTCHFFQGPPGCWFFYLVSCSHPWNRPLDLTIEFSLFELWASLSWALLKIFPTYKIFNPVPTLGNALVRIMLAAITNTSPTFQWLNNKYLFLTHIKLKWEYSWPEGRTQAPSRYGSIILESLRILFVQLVGG